MLAHRIYYRFYDSSPNRLINVYPLTLLYLYALAFIQKFQNGGEKMDTQSKQSKIERKGGDPSHLVAMR